MVRSVQFLPLGLLIVVLVKRDLVKMFQARGLILESIFQNFPPSGFLGA